LIGPIVSAVLMCMRPEWTNLGLRWIEAFDQLKLTEILQTMRSLDLFSERSIGSDLSIALKNKLFKILGPAVAAEPARPTKVKAGPKLAAADRSADAADGGGIRKKQYVGAESRCT
jgi:hypothetical protein